MTQHTLFVCILCRSSKVEQPQTGLNLGQSLFNWLNEQLKESEGCETFRLQPVRCMGACDRACVVAFTAPAKLTFVLSKLSFESLPDLLKFSRQYVACAGGKVPYGERPEAVRRGIHAVLPPLPFEHQ